MALGNCSNEIQDCDLGQMTFEQLFRKLLRADGNCLYLNTGDANAMGEQTEVRGYAKNITTTTSTEILPADATLKSHITSLVITNGSLSVGTIVDIIEESTGDILWTGFAAANGGFSITFQTPLIQTTANKKIYAKCTTTSADVTVSISGYKK